MAKELAVNNAVLQKACSENNIPLPERGHWSKIRFSKSVDNVELPDKTSWNNEVQLVNVVNSSPLNELARKIEAENASLLIVPKNLKRPDSLITITKLHWQNLKRRDYSLGEKFLSIGVSDNCKARSLRFVNALIKLLKARG